MDNKTKTLDRLAYQANFADVNDKPQDQYHGKKIKRLFKRKKENVLSLEKLG